MDLETTGTDSLRNDIISLSMSVCDRHRELDSIELKIRPVSNYWSPEAEAVHGISRFEADRFSGPRDCAETIDRFLSPHKHAVIVCHAAFMFNSYFDINFLNQFLSENLGHNYLYSKTLARTSTITWYRWLDRLGIERNDKYDLAYLCKKYRINLDHHNAASDRKACQTLFFKALDLAKQAEPELDNGFSKFI